MSHPVISPYKIGIKTHISSYLHIATSMAHFDRMQSLRPYRPGSHRQE